MSDQSIKQRLQEALHTVNVYATAARTATELSHEATPIIDSQFLAIAERATSHPDSLFSVIDPKYLVLENRPDAIIHHKTRLDPNPYRRQETEETLGLVDFLLGEQVSEAQATFSEGIGDVGLLERIEANSDRVGKKFLIVSNHLELADQGFSIGLLHKVAIEQGLDNMENHITALIGRAIGYFQFGDKNVIDGVLRKVGSVLKTFPTSGSEAITDEEKILTAYRVMCNHLTKNAYRDMISDRDGRVIFIAPSGEQDKFEEARNVVKMASFGSGTCQMMIDACNEGAEILPLFVDYDYAKQKLSLAKFMGNRTVHSIADCHDIGLDIARAGTTERAKAYAAHPDIKRFSASIEYNRIA
jgi:hypothetical protein